MLRKISLILLINLFFVNSISFAFEKEILSPLVTLDTLSLKTVFSQGITHKLDVSLLENIHPALKTIVIKFKYEYPGFLSKIIKTVNKHKLPLQWYQMVRKRDGTFSFRFDVHALNLQADRLVDDLRLIDDRQDSDYDPESFSCRHRVLELKLNYQNDSLLKITEFLKENYINVACFLTPVIEPGGESLFTFEIEIPAWLSDAEVVKDLQCTINCDENNVFLSEGTLIDAVIEQYLSFNIKNNISRDYLKTTLGVMIRHLSQSRKDKKTPFIMHQIEVVNILLDSIKIPQDNRMLLQIVIAAAILHDAIEDGDIKDEDLKKQFGDQVYYIVDLLTNRRNNGEKDELKYLQKILQGKEIWGLIAKIIKIADRIHNIKTLNIGNPAFERRVFFSTIHDFLPEFVAKIKIRPEDVADSGIDIRVWQKVLKNAQSELNKQIFQMGKKMKFLNAQGKIDKYQWNQYSMENKYPLKSLHTSQGLTIILDHERQEKIDQARNRELLIQGSI